MVLDESQAIKNPVSQVAKASLLIKSKNKLALSGTPIQNNTFDLFAQMNFLNPGMLGSMEFFRSEFANPIDKMQEPEAKAYLRKLINPFLLQKKQKQYCIAKWVQNNARYTMLTKTVSEAKYWAK